MGVGCNQMLLEGRGGKSAHPGAQVVRLLLSGYIVGYHLGAVRKSQLCISLKMAHIRPSVWWDMMTPVTACTKRSVMAGKRKVVHGREMGWISPL